MKKVFLLSLFFMLMVSISIFAQTITSTVTGGDWDDTGTWVGSVVPLSGNDVIIVTGATVTVNGTFSCASLIVGNDPGIALLTFSGSNPTLTVTGSVSVGIIAGNGKTAGDITFINGSTLIANSLTLTSVKDNASQIIMTLGGTLKTESLNTAIEGGNPIDAVWTPGTGTVELTATNTLPASLITTFNNLTISGGTTTLVTDIALTGTLTLTNSLLILGSSNLLLGSTSTIAGTPSATNMVVATGLGELRKTFTATGSFTFPVGDNTGTAEYSPATLDFTAGTFTSAYAGVNLVNAKHSSNTSTTDFITRYWTVTSSGISGFSCNVTFTYVDADINGIEADLFCSTWSGIAWTLLNAVNTVTNELTGTVTSFSDFTGGEASALPVELSSFSASVTKTGVLLNWKTETEVNNYGFEIQRTTPRPPPYKGGGVRQLPDGGDWITLGFIEGHGNSNSPKEYNFIDSEVNSAGIYSYRLKQIDNDGSFEYSKTIEVNFGSPIKFELSQNYPNPFNPSTTINFNLPKSGATTLKVYNLMGEEIKTLVEGYKEAGVYTVNFNAEGLPSGMYIYQMSTPEKTQVRKMILMK